MAATYPAPSDVIDLYIRADTAVGRTGTPEIFLSFLSGQGLGLGRTRLVCCNGEAARKTKAGYYDEIIYV
jgi:hypothetical protein